MAAFHCALAQGSTLLFNPSHRGCRGVWGTAGSGRHPFGPGLTARCGRWRGCRCVIRIGYQILTYAVGREGATQRQVKKFASGLSYSEKTRWNSTRRAKDYLVDFFIAEHFIDNMRPNFLIYLYSILPSRMTTATNASSGVNNSRPSRHVAQHATAAAS